MQKYSRKISRHDSNKLTIVLVLGGLGLLLLVWSVSVVRAEPDRGFASWRVRVVERGPHLSWPELSRDDPSGAGRITVYDPDHPAFGSLAEKLAELGIGSGSALELPAELAGTSDPEALRQEDSFGSNEEWFPKSAAGRSGELVHRELTEVLGRSLAVETRLGESPGELAVTDDWGGLRREHWGPAGLIDVEDDSGPLVHLHRDAAGRLTEIILAGRYRVSYQYSRPAPWPYWRRKVVEDLATGEMVLAMVASAPPGDRRRAEDAPTTRPRPQLWVDIKGGGRQVEWDPLVYPETLLVAERGVSPYALLSLAEPTRLVARSLTVDAHGTVFGSERIDYTDREIILHLQRNVALGNRAETEILRLPRSYSPVAGLLDPTVDPCGGSGSNDTGSEPGSLPGQPLSPDQQLAVNSASNKATKQVDSLSTCSGLFAGLPGALDPPSGFPSSTTYRYDPNSTGCTTGFAAWTKVGSYLVHLCDAFFAGGDSNNRAATLIHEGLHSAGLSENPPDPTAMSAAEIQAMVKGNCGL